ncbi:MAG: hypothetical protein NTY77_08360 [Elusimicrobia bacterium]|nr:hypothetical protein [Elusimicrobiota bacterium]
MKDDILFYLVFTTVCVVGVGTMVRWFLDQLRGAKSPAAPAQAGGARRKFEDLLKSGRLDSKTAAELWAALRLPGPAPALPPPPAVGISVRPAPAELPIPQAAPHAAGGISSDIKTLLISGSTLFVLSAYIFVRTYWEVIPPEMKFLFLVLMTAGIYGGGRLLHGKGRTPSTAETLMDLGVALVPFVFFAADVLILGKTLTYASAWGFGCAGMALAALASAAGVPTLSMGIILAVGCHGAVYLACLSSALDPQSQALALACAALALLAAACAVPMDERLRKGLTAGLNTGALAAGALLAMHGFFMNQPQHLLAGLTLVLLGITFAVQARLFNPLFAYAAGLCFMGGAAVLLHHKHVPPYRYGLLLVPCGLLSTLRAWTFERAGRKKLAEPYFVLGQAAAGFSIAMLMPAWSSYVHDGFASMMMVLMLAALAYGSMGAMYGAPAYTYASSLMLLAALGAAVQNGGHSFTMGALEFTAAAYVLLAAALLGGEKRQEQLGTPLTAVGLGTMSLSLAVTAGRWAEPILTGKTAHSGLPPEQLTTALTVALLGAAAYAAVGWARKRTEFLYPALASATLAYVFILEKLGGGVDPLTVSWVVAAALGACYVLDILDWEKPSRCFAVWGEVFAALVAIWSLSSPAATALPAATVCLLAFLPGLWVGRMDLVAGAVIGGYLLHWLWFDKTGHGKASDYALHLLLVNCVMVAARTLVSAVRPTASVEPFRALVPVFSALSLLLVVTDADTAWQLYSAYGVLALVVSLVHYDGKHLWGGAALLLCGYEFFLSASHVTQTEAYTVPPALFLLVCGHLLEGETKQRREQQDALLVAGQLVLYLPSFAQALDETWQLHGVFVGMASLALVLWGMTCKKKALTTLSLLVMLVNAGVQSRQMFYAIPRWAYLAVGGLTLVGLGGMFEFKSDSLVKLKDSVAQKLDSQDGP